MSETEQCLMYKQQLPKASPSPAGDCFYSVRQACTRHIEHTTAGFQALPMLTELLSVPTMKESIF